MIPPDHPPDTILAALLATALGSTATLYQDPLLVGIAGLVGGVLSLQRQPTREWWRALLHLAICIGIPLVLADLLTQIVAAEAPARWAMSRHQILAAVALLIGWAWPDRIAWLWRQVAGWRSGWRPPDDPPPPPPAAGGTPGSSTP